MREDPAQVADAVAVRVGEAARVDLVDDPAPPVRVASGGTRQPLPDRPGMTAFAAVAAAAAALAVLAAVVAVVVAALAAAVVAAAVVVGVLGVALLGVARRVVLLVSLWCALPLVALALVSCWSAFFLLSPLGTLHALPVVGGIPRIGRVGGGQRGSRSGRRVMVRQRDGHGAAATAASTAPDRSGTSGARAVRRARAPARRPPPRPGPGVRRRAGADQRHRPGEGRDHQDASAATGAAAATGGGIPGRADRAAQRRGDLRRRRPVVRDRAVIARSVAPSGSGSVAGTCGARCSRASGRLERAARRTPGAR